jgi:hypothetical protein
LSVRENLTKGEYLQVMERIVLYAKCEYLSVRENLTKRRMFAGHGTDILRSENRPALALSRYKIRECYAAFFSSLSVASLSRRSVRGAVALVASEIPTPSIPTIVTAAIKIPHSMCVLLVRTIYERFAWLPSARLPF